MDRAEALARSFVRAAEAQDGARPFSALLQSGNGELLQAGAKSRSKRLTEGTAEFCRAALALEALAVVEPRMGMGRSHSAPPAPRAAVRFAAPASPTAAASNDDGDGLQIVPLRLQSCPANIQRKGIIVAADASERNRLLMGTRSIFMALAHYLAPRKNILGVTLLVTFPRLIVSVVIRTFKAMFGQVCAELAVGANDAWEQLASAASEQVSAIEASVLNGTMAAAAPPLTFGESVDATNA